MGTPVWGPSVVRDPEGTDYPRPVPSPHMGASAEATIREYYDALRAGEPLGPFFAEDGPVVKVGIGERMTGADAVAGGLAEQTRSTADWVVESRDLHVGAVADGTARDGAVRDATDDALGGTDAGGHRFAWFGDDVFMGWTEAERGIRFEFDTRWSGALARLGRDGGDGTGWRFVEMHVSTPGET